MRDRGTYGGQVITGNVTTTDMKFIGTLAVIGGIVLVINLWPLREDRRQRKNLEQLLERHRAWQQSRRDTQP